MSTQVYLFTNVEPTSVSPAIAKPVVSRSTFYFGDCLVEMDKIADKSVDMILCDLPYGTTACKWDSVIPFEPLWMHYKRIIKTNGAIVLTASQPFTTALINSNIKNFKYAWVWDKKVGANFTLCNKQPLKVHEDVLVFGYDKTKYYPIKVKGAINHGHKNKSDNTPGFSNKIKMRPDTDFSGMKFPKSIIEFPKHSSQQKLHPTEKPLYLMEYLIKTYTNEGETVLDNCMGSGTTGVACKKTGRHFIGIEKDEKYFEIAVKRINSYV